ncbi:MAG TPA: tRNA adenosine(34) deaminase TadA [Desulfocapsa sulfexigens]|nr:tRNA adenosine(34) deaminase TadA [Desulfocapsa sulfexigens]
MDQRETDIFFMKQTILLAESAAQKGEVPVGALISLDNNIVGKGENCPIWTNDPSGHAEIIAIREAAKSCNNYRIPGTTLYVTLEPCIMCMGAIIHARIKRVVFGAYDPKTGAAGSRYSIGSDNLLNHHLEITGGICKKKCANLIKTFFRERRKNRTR